MEASTSTSSRISQAIVYPRLVFSKTSTAIKRKRGEQDEVTIVASDPPPNGASVEDEIRMRRHRRNVKSSERYKRRKRCSPGRDRCRQGSGRRGPRSIRRGTASEKAR